MQSALDLLAVLPWPAAIIDAAGAIVGANGTWTEDVALTEAAASILAGGEPWDGVATDDDGKACHLRVRPLGAGGAGLGLVLRAPPEAHQLARVSLELEKAQHLQKGLLDSIPDIAWLKDEQGRFVAVNEALARTVGASSVAEMVGKADIDFSPPDLAERYRADNRRVMETRRSSRFEEEHVGPHGERFWIETIKVPILDDRDQVIGTAGVARDVTERKKAEEVLRRSHTELEALVASRTEELARANDRLLQAQNLEAVGRLAGGVAHDFNNLLTVIQASIVFAERLLDPAHAARAELAQIATAASRASELTRQLLSFARRQVLAPSVISLSNLVMGADKILRRLLGEHIELVTLTDPGIDRVEVDPGQFDNVVLNLALNARDAMPAGGTLTIRTSTVVVRGDETGELAGVEPGRWVALEVTDTGTGISQEALPHIFEPFFTTKGRAEGTGLGLATCYGIVRQAHGHIRATSQPGSGSRFLVLVPSAGSGQEAALPPEARSEVGGRETILLVEDEPQVRTLVARTLEELGYRVLVASSGADGLAVAGAHRGAIDLVISDIVMPKMSGLQMVSELSQRRAPLLVLFVSGYAAEIVDLERLPARAHFLAKPFTPDALAQHVRRLLDEAAAARGPAPVVPLRAGGG